MSSQSKAVIDIIKNCTFGKIDDKVDTLPTYDIEYMFRTDSVQKSVGETIEVTVTCPDDETTKVPVTINLDDLKLLKQKDIRMSSWLLIRLV